MSKFKYLFWILLIAFSLRLANIYKTMQNKSVTLRKSNTERKLKITIQTASEEYQDIMPVYTNIKQFLRSTEAGILQTSPPNFIRDMRNPCFALDKGFINVGNITLSYAIDKGYEIRCLPGLFLAGFPKCGTNDMFFTALRHRNIQAAITKDGLRWMSKEMHYWDNHACHPNYTMDNYTRRYQISQGVDDNGKTILTQLRTNETDYNNFLFLDGTPRLFWHGDTWQRDIENRGLTSPRVLMPHKVHHILPNSKFIIILRNPVDRLFSDYRYYADGNVTAENFHVKVTNAISWWKTCTQKYPIRTCAYGQPPSDLQSLAYITCIDKSKNLTARTEGEDGCFIYKQWNECRNSANRLRVGMYDVFIKDWLELFPKSSILGVKLEYFTNHKLAIVEDGIIPFLNLPPLLENEAQVLKRHDERNAIPGTKKLHSTKKHTSITMLPSTKAILEDFYSTSKQKLVKILGGHISWD